MTFGEKGRGEGEGGANAKEGHEITRMTEKNDGKLMDEEGKRRLLKGPIVLLMDCIFSCE